MNPIVNRGPDRWRRAAINALEHPNSQAAILYRGRVAVAAEVAGAHEDHGKNRVYRHNMVRYRYVTENGRTISKSWIGAEFYTCSVYCTLMEMQLRHGSRLETIAAAFTERMFRRNYAPFDTMDEMPLVWEPVNEKDMKRTNRCQCCAKNIGPRRKPPRPPTVYFPKYDPSSIWRQRYGFS